MSKKLLSRQEYEEFLANLPKDVCAFCAYQKYQIILREGENWIWIASLAPYWPYHTMLVPKRHFQYLWEMSVTEMAEFRELNEMVMKFYREKKLYRGDGSLIKQYVSFWRLRDDPYDPISKNNRPDHFHLHIAPDQNHLWDPILDPQASLWEVSEWLMIN